MDVLGRYLCRIVWNRRHLRAKWQLH